MSDRKFTLDELAKFDGKDGRPAYVANGGVVYDATASKLWRNGTHVRVHHAGNDLTEGLTVAPHPADRLEKLPRVGVLEQTAAPTPAAEATEVPFFARFSYKMHAHPASVHFPIALCAMSAALTFFGWFLDCPEFKTVAWYNLVAGLALSPAPIISGFVDWIYQYDKTPTRLFVGKIVLSGVFFAVGVLAVFFKLALGGGLVYELLVISLGPVILGVAFLGGRITFPS